MKVHVCFDGRRLLRYTGTTLLIGGLVAVGTWAWFLAEGRVYQAAQNESFERVLAPHAALDRPINNRPQADNLPYLDPRIIGRLEIPRIALTVLVREGVDAASLRKAVGHLPSSSPLGESGNFVVLGHRDTFFRPLRDIALGDLVRMRTREGVIEYEVESVFVVEPDQALTMEVKTGSYATLITCFPFNFVGPSPRRFVVRARRRMEPHVQRQQTEGS